MTKACLVYVTLGNREGQFSRVGKKLDSYPVSLRKEIRTFKIVVKLLQDIERSNKRGRLRIGQLIGNLVFMDISVIFSRMGVSTSHIERLTK